LFKESTRIVVNTAGNKMAIWKCTI
jgi:hypothetical protein